MEFSIRLKPASQLSFCARFIPRLPVAPLCTHSMNMAVHASQTPSVGRKDATILDNINHDVTSRNLSETRDMTFVRQRCDIPSMLGIMPARERDVAKLGLHKV